MIRSVFLFTCCMVLCFIADCQHKSQDILYSKNLPNSNVMDTCHYVYIERNRDAKCYKDLSDISDIETTAKKLSQQHKIKRPADDIKNLPQNWCALKSLYKGELFLYAPCDWYTHSITTIRNNVLIRGPQSDLDVKTNISLSKISDRRFKVRYKIEKQDANLPDVPLGFNIYIVDTENNVAVFESLYKNGRHEYDLMVDMRHVHAFPVIVNHCRCSKQREYRFENDGHYIDFPQTIKQNKVVIHKPG